MGEHNIAPNTQIGKIEIPHKVYANENIYNNAQYTRSGEFIENLVVDNIIEFAHRWFHLGGVKDVIDDLDELCIKNNLPPYSEHVGKGHFGRIILFKDNDNMISTPIRITDNDSYSKAFYIYSHRDKNITYESLFEKNNK